MSQVLFRHHAVCLLQVTKVLSSVILTLHAHMLNVVEEYLP